MFCDKYEVDMNVTTVANRLSTVIVNYELTLKINNNKDHTYDFEIEDEIDEEEINLKDVDSFLDHIQSEESNYRNQEKTNFQNLSDEGDLDIPSKNTFDQIHLIEPKQNIESLGCQNKAINVKINDDKINIKENLYKENAQPVLF